MTSTRGNIVSEIRDHINSASGEELSEEEVKDEMILASARYFGDLRKMNETGNKLMRLVDAYILVLRGLIGLISFRKTN